MPSTHTTLDSLFDVMREEPAMSAEKLAALVETPAAVRTDRGVRTVIAALGLVAVVTAIFVLASGNHDAARPTVVPSPKQGSRPVDRPVASTERGTSPPATAASSPRAPRTASTAAIAPMPSVTDVEALFPTSVAIPVTVDPSRMLELTREELAAIGVRVASDGIVESYGGGISTIRKGSDPMKVELSISQFRFLPDGGTARFIASDSMPDGIHPTGRPRFVTDLDGNRFYFQMSAEHGPRPIVVSRIRDSLNRVRLFEPFNADGLIPVRVADRILWYSPSPSFIDALPACLREQIVRELDTAATAELAEGRERWVKAGAGLPADQKRAYDSVKALLTRTPAACGQPGTGVRLLDTWRSQQGAVRSSALLPNNFRESTTLRVDLTEPRTIAVTLHDAQGRRIQQIVDGQAAPAGEMLLPVRLESVAPGLYLIVIHTDRGERTVLRAVIE